MLPILFFSVAWMFFKYISALDCGLFDFLTNSAQSIKYPSNHEYVLGGQLVFLNNSF